MASFPALTKALMTLQVHPRDKLVPPALKAGTVILCAYIVRALAGQSSLTLTHKMMSESD